ncbi:MAG: hypothetical protein AAF675_04535 [Pseudomonadota bacterium]
MDTKRAFTGHRRHWLSPALRRVCLALLIGAPVAGEAQTRLESEAENTLSIIRQIGDVPTAVSGPARVGDARSPSGIEQIGDVDRAAIVQVGQGNTADVSTESAAAPTRAIILQQGRDHLAATRQSGRAAALMVQSGAGHTALARQQGDAGGANNALILQSGQRNTAIVDQSVAGGVLLPSFGANAGNQVLISQQGSDNIAISEQSGQGNSADLRQNGFANGITLSQDGGQSIAVRQTGVGHVFDFDQTGTDMSPMTVTQSGVNAPPVMVTRSGPGR